MNLKPSIITASFLMMLTFSGCNEAKEESKEPKLEKPKETLELPVQMIKSPDGSYYFPENIHRPKSDKDSLVWVKPSDLK